MSNLENYFDEWQLSGSDVWDMMGCRASCVVYYNLFCEWCQKMSSHWGALKKKLKKKKNLLSKYDVKSMQKLNVMSPDLSYNFDPFYPLAKRCLEKSNSFKTSGTFMVCGSCLSFHRTQPCEQIVTAGMSIICSLGTTSVCFMGTAVSRLTAFCFLMLKGLLIG